MSSLLFLLYNLIGVPLLFVIFGLGGFFKEKIKKGKRGRRGLFDRLRGQIGRLEGDAPRLWLHASSMGEFEQLKPVIAEAKVRFPRLDVVVSFFSPSVYDHVEDYPEADIITYLPVDTYFNARRFFRTTRPSLGIVVRHDIWPNHVRYLHETGVPIVLVDAALSKKINERGVAGRIVGRLLYSHFDYLLAISATEAGRLRAVCGPGPRVEVFGDTRFDQVYRRSLERDKIRALQSSDDFKGRPVLVAGSTWPSDERHLMPAFSRLLTVFPDLRMIVVPHEPSGPALSDLEGRLENHGLRNVRMSQWQPGADEAFHVMIVDSIGLLANIYALGQVAYVGGGFGPGLHNVLEPAVHGCPVLFGPRAAVSSESATLVERGGGFKVKNSEEVYERLQELFGDAERCAQAATAARQVIEENMGATKRTLDLIERWLQ